MVRGAVCPTLDILGECVRVAGRVDGEPVERLFSGLRGAILALLARKGAAVTLLEAQDELDVSGPVLADALNHLSVRLLRCGVPLRRPRGSFGFAGAVTIAARDCDLALFLAGFLEDNENQVRFDPVRANRAFLRAVALERGLVARFADERPKPVRVAPPPRRPVNALTPDPAPGSATTMRAIAGYVAKAHGLDVATLCGPSRLASVARARLEAMEICRRLLKKSHPEVGRFFGGRDHTCVVNAVRRVNIWRAQATANAAVLS